MKKVKKLKTYVLTVSKNFIGKHPRAGESTMFKDKILSGEKRHTVRNNYAFWKKRIDKINAGEALLSVRQWSGKPYNSKQIEITQFTKLGFESIISLKMASSVSIGGDVGSSQKRLFLSDKQIKTLAKNDGLGVQDFKDWFKQEVDFGIIIHFTNLEYLKKWYV